MPAREDINKSATEDSNRPLTFLFSKNSHVDTSVKNYAPRALPEWHSLLLLAWRLIFDRKNWLQS